VTEKRCPRCGDVSLTPIEIDAVVLHRCTRCGGSFLGTSQFDKLVDLAKRGSAPVVEPPDARPKETLRDSIGCPVCSKPMKTIEFEGDSKILVDVCRSDGLWLDGGEIAAIVDRERASREHQEGVDAAKSLAKDAATSDVAAAVGGGLLGVLFDLVAALF
jgi:Zn-finger nucleic acid-binding protein